MTLHRRTFLNSAAVAAAASLPGCMVVAPAVASICKAAPYIPAADPDAALFEHCAAFERACARDAATWERYVRLPIDSPDALEIAASFDAGYHEWAATSDACYATSPASPAGAAALLGVILVRDADFIDEAAKKPLRLVRDALASMARR